MKGTVLCITLSRLIGRFQKKVGFPMTIDEARTWFQRHADNTPMPGAREAYKTILEELQRTRWIPVEERLPEELKPVLFAVYPKDIQLYNKYGKVVYLAWRENGEWLDWEGKRVSDVFIVTHWMPMPEPPGVGYGKTGNGG